VCLFPDLLLIISLVFLFSVKWYLALCGTAVYLVCSNLLVPIWLRLASPHLFGADGARWAMRMSYRKHVDLAKSGSIKCDDPHSAGLFGALGTRYKLLGRVPNGAVSEVVLWGELAPFLAMPQEEAVEALAEYVVAQEKPRQARLAWLKSVVNRAAMGISDQHLLLAEGGLRNNAFWSSLLDENTHKELCSRIDRLIHKVRSASEHS
jgi:hypothetical protein